MNPIAISYTILPGDSYYKIARQLGTCSSLSTEMLMSANPGILSTALQVGQKLNTTKDGPVYVVRPGDTFSEIAEGLRAASGATADQIEAVNPGIAPTALQIGAVINLPNISDDSTASASTHPVPTHTRPITIEPVNAEIIGYWDWTWHRGSGPAEATLGIAFSGWADIETAIQQSAKVKTGLIGTKYICIGGGNKNGSFTVERVEALIKAIANNTFDGYEGIALDIEEGAAHLEDPFAEVFKTAKQKGLDVLVTVSHCAPFGVSDAGTLMHSFFSDSNIDILSPQLYTTGKEEANNYATSHGISWSDYASCKAAVAPSIVKASMYPSARAYFDKEGVALKGYIQWSQS